LVWPESLSFESHSGAIEKVLKGLSELNACLCEDF
jgi:hypothetical protein